MKDVDKETTKGGVTLVRRIILTVDDEANIRLIVSRLLSKTFTVLEAKDGEEAVRIASKEKPDLILMDIMMPKMDGYTACAAIKNDALLRKTPIVMVSGVGFQLNKDLAEKVGANGYITKPFMPDDLRATVARFLGPE
jgi:CheY-like chemotaxis protein